MNKSNFNDFLTKTLTTYTFLLVIIIILKLVGLNYFGLDVNNPILQKINDFCIKFNLTDVWYVITMWIYGYFIFSMTCNCNDKRMKKYTFLCLPIIMLVNYLETKFSIMIINCLIDFVYLLILALVFNYKYKINSKKQLVINYVKIVILNLLFQFISIITRIGYFEKTNYNFIINIILDIDYILLMIIYYKIKFEGGSKICLEMVVSSSSQKKILLRKLLTKLQKNLDNFKKKSRVEKLEISIFIVLSLLWNTLSVVLILLVAKLNDTLIECIFILTSFWLSKTAFGKPFHFSKMSTCFIVSNLTYYALNRITTPLGISIVVPIILGVGLSYVTSKFVKPVATKLYKGMTEDDFNNSILNVTDKDSLQYKICHMFYVERKSELEIAHNVGYSIDNIKKIKAKINKKIKELN